MMVLRNDGLGSGGKLKALPVIELGMPGLEVKDV
jgi:hypothetical protein